MNWGKVTRERGTSSAVGTILLAGVAIILAIGIGTFVMQLGPPAEPGQAALEVDDGDELTLVSEGNVEEVLIRDEDGYEFGPISESGESIDLSPLSPERDYSVIGVVDGEETLLRTLESEEVDTDVSTPNPDSGDVELEDLYGSGTEDDPYQIYTDQQLQAIEQDRDAHYELRNDIDASETGQWHRGYGFDPIGEDRYDHEWKFTGSFDGRGKEIRGLTINRDYSGIGLFASTYRATIENTTLVDVRVHGGSNVGGLVGENEDGVVRNCSVSGEVSGEWSKIGGLVGITSEEVGLAQTVHSVSSADVDGKYSVGGLVGVQEGNVTESYATGDVAGEENVGGLVGYLEKDRFSGTVADSYASGDVSGDEIVGGLVGYQDSGNVTTSYASGPVDGSEDGGGLIGDSDVGGAATESYWDEETTGQSGSDGGTGLETDDMQGDDAKAEMDGFEFGDVWVVAEGEYPELEWEND